MPQIAVIIVSWNCKEELFRCFDSINRKKNPDIKIFVVDNASEDGTKTECPNKYPHVRFLGQQQNLGFAKANNIAWNADNAEFSIILNPDTVVLDDAIETLAGFMTAHPDCGLAAPLLLNEKNEIVESTFKFPSLWNYWTEHSILVVLLEKLGLQKNKPLSVEQTMQPAREIEWATGAAFIIRRDALEEQPLFDEQFFMYSEDADLCKRLAKKGWKRFLVPSAKVIHSHRASSSKARARTIFHLFNSLFLYFKKHKGGISQFFLRLSISMDMFARIIIIYLFCDTKNSKNGERLKGYKNVLKALNPFFAKPIKKEI
ncbi:MAG TPA: glycosyltransferase family 2 protein [Candidatus Sumerlaeota bacterium]|nr:MAG: N-acetylglucosaminyl-diphospho-decaprenol L-rhamnosyltransferase [candidate division BRC1 bacterium ADurb.Bin183]HOE64157.1 glycosyltransferase family 2 protein [Candidatus Sumerlaeota bacterium]HRR30477.1 glycosyltransferase family 2 protein [Candidatus Sumerlaeia bacterium]HON51057.1 glycosyltransferase family 2 protein [Candidatus Sumerlaeota bacterium]HOR65064.1 glycosyltransferase family 2 protein [Candidatus Sumerlaeota bacterium]